MKNIITLLLIFSIGHSFADEGEIFSFYFHQSSMMSLDNVQSVKPFHFGRYDLKNTEENEMRIAAGEYLVSDPTGIYLEKNRLLSISREEIRENSKYSVVNGYLHGVVENDSVLVALDGDKYYFLIPVKAYFYDKTARADRMFQISKNSYALFNYQDNGHYSVMVVQFNNGGVLLKEIEMKGTGKNSLESILTKKEIKEESESIKAYVLTPNRDEWMNIIFSSCLVTFETYVRKSE